MISIAAPIRSIVAEIEPHHFEPTISVEIKNIYGQEKIYVKEGSVHKEPLLALTGTKTLSPTHIQALKALGFHFFDSVQKRNL
jgi:hypothetical protein